jgi:hypothetical protein
LVIWRHSRKDDEVAQLLSALFSTDVQIKYSDYMGDLPVTKDALESLGESKDAEIDTFIETLNTGRLFSTTKFGGMLENQLSTGLMELWANLLKNPPDNLRESIQRTLEPLQRRFDMMNVR